MNVERHAEVSGADSLGEAVGAEKVGALVRDHRDLQVAAALLVRGREIDVGVGWAVGRADIPLAALATRVLGLQRLHLLLHLEVGKRGLHLLSGLQLGALRFLLLGQDGLHGADEAGALQLESPASFARHAGGALPHEGG